MNIRNLFSNFCRIMPYLWIILFGNLVAAQESNTAQGGPYVYPIGNNTLLYFVSSTITLIGPER